MIRLLTILLLATFALAESSFPAAVGGVILLKQENSPYALSENFALQPSDTLRIEPGVTVLMGSYAKLLLNGAVEILGTEKQPVKMLSADTTESWNGIHFISSNSPFLVKHLIVENAFRNTVSQASGIFEGSEFIDNYYGLWIYASPLTVIKHCKFSRNRFALSVASSIVNAEGLHASKNIYGLYLEGNSKFNGSKDGIKDNMEADVREGSVASGKDRVPLSVWQRVEAQF